MLGPIEVRRYGRLLSVPGGKTSELLVRLALDAGELVRTDRLVDDLWAAGGVNTRRNTLQSKVAKLRRALGDPPVIVSGNGGYSSTSSPPTSMPSRCWPRRLRRVSSQKTATTGPPPTCACRR